MYTRDQKNVLLCFPIVKLFRFNRFKIVKDSCQIKVYLHKYDATYVTQSKLWTVLGRDSLTLKLLSTFYQHDEIFGNIK